VMWSIIIIGIIVAHVHNLLLPSKLLCYVLLFCGYWWCCVFVQCGCY